MQIKFMLTRKFAGAVLLGLLITGAAVFGGTQYYTSRSSFCGTSCHVMNEPYQAWKTSKHHADNNQNGKQANCVDCHFLPGGKMTWKAQFEGARHLAAYLYDPDAPLPIRAVVKDGACLRSGCHAKRKLKDKEIQFTKKVKFKHGVHFGEKALKGQALTCDTCHFKVSEKKHFEVPKEICYLCHLIPQGTTPDQAPTPSEIRMVKFNGGAAKGSARNGAPVAPEIRKVKLNEAVAKEPARNGASIRSKIRRVKFNKGAAKCALCHTIPTKSLQAQTSTDDPNAKPITHQTLEKAGVACESCHLEVVEGGGTIEAGRVNSSGCVKCHNWLPARIAAELDDATRMHDKHVKTRRADCFDCHRVIRHGAKRDYLDNVRSACTSCHEDQHRYQRLLLTGAARGEGIPETPGLMHAVKTNCTGCHVKEVHANGQTTKTGSVEACVECHGEEQRRMLKDWKDTLAREVKDVKEMEQEAQAAIAAAKSKVSAQSLGEAQALLRTGREDLRIVEYGNGVHNKKYAMMLIDQALTSFEDLVDNLQADDLQAKSE